MGYVPPGLDQVFQGLGAGENKAKDAVRRMKDISRGAFYEIWKVRCEEQQKAEQEAGITEDLKKDREEARAYRAARWDNNGITEELDEEQGTTEEELELEGDRWERVTERLRAAQRNQVEKITRRIANMRIEQPQKYQYRRSQEKGRGIHHHHKGGCDRKNHRIE